LTVTHARIRVRQGDFPTARRILAAILEFSPAHPGARALLDEIGGRASAEPLGTDHGKVSGEDDDSRRVVEHLSRWLDRIKRNAGAPGA
jgi:hypothetical protein